MSSMKRLTNEQVLGRLAAAWEDVKSPKHWAYEGSWTNSTLRTLGQFNKLAGAGSGSYILSKVVVNRRGRLAASGGVALGGTAIALGAHSWEVIKDTFKRTIGTVPSFITNSAVLDLGLGVAYAIGKNPPPKVTPRYDEMRNTYESYRVEAASRGILPPDYALPLENAFQEHSAIQQSIASLTTAAAVTLGTTLIQAGKAGPHRGWHGKYAISKAIGVTLQEMDDLYLDMKDSYLRRVGRGGFHEGPSLENEDFAPEPAAYEAPAVPYHVDHANALGRAEAAARDYAIQMAEHFANQMNNGVAPANVQGI